MLENILPFGYVYKTVNSVNNKIYVGKRQKSVFDKYYIGSGKKLKSAVKCYGRENFYCEVIQWCFTLEELNAAEKYWINKLAARDLDTGYNISYGGDGGDVFHSLSIDKQNETITKQKATTVVNGNGAKGKYRVYKISGNEVFVKYISPTELELYLAEGWVHGLEPTTAKKQGESRTGKKQSKEWVEKRAAAIKNKIGTERELLHERHSTATKTQMAKMSKEEKTALAKKARAASLAKIKGKAIWINKDDCKKLISECDFGEWEYLGWKRGMK